MAKSDLDARMEARRARVEAAKAKAEAGPDSAPVSAPSEPITDYWKLPKTGGPTTILNSAWTWTMIVYVVIMAIALFSVVQNELTILDKQSNTARIAIAVGLIYPAWRIGLTISKFMKKRGIGAGFSVGDTLKSSVSTGPKPAKAARPGSVEARMEARRARVEQARKDGKI